MGFVTVRCPECRGQSRVDAVALQLTVQCPRCSGVFVALEEAEVVTPRPASRTNRIPEPLPAIQPEPLAKTAEPVQDLDRQPPESLPVSVLIGLALLPFAIPILWLMAPVVLGQEPTLSWAVPLALAISTSTLCLAVIYTIDWTPATRVKGVLMMVGLSYFAAVNLYFLKKQMLDEVKKFFGAGQDWVAFSPPDDTYQVKLPNRPNGTDEQPMPRMARLACFRLTHTHLLEKIEFVVGSGKPQAGANALAAADDWYDQAVDEIVAQAGGRRPGRTEKVTQQDHTGREFEIDLGGGRVRVVRLFIINGRVYYLAVEGEGPPNDALVVPFFSSFIVNNAG